MENKSRNLTEMYGQYASARLSGKHNVISSFNLVYPYLKDRKVLDIGCSDGLYLKYFRPDSVGIEQMEELGRNARSAGLSVIVGDVPSVLSSLGSGSFSSVFFSHVMEHLDAPIVVLREIYRVLEPGGYLVLGLPTENNLFRFVFRKDYFAGTHLYSFSVKNAKKLLHAAGFAPVRVFYDLPRCRGAVGRSVIRTYQHFPFKEQISMAYWIVARKTS